eukprot:NODE_340_length_2645_cov_52.763283_g320_i0.p1 GENE.NODE_340_length_2645_cov_52.763283_g320_i0~~NODE_340_length_2645_cov_52.763283_g320_i0.p1  ORF type:complete len:813 (-),score=178.16 NODE_340_length_2645_cov_52.763283_g320_i0:79-2517(-)
MAVDPNDISLGEYEDEEEDETDDDDEYSLMLERFRQQVERNFTGSSAPPSRTPTQQRQYPRSPEQTPRSNHQDQGVTPPRRVSPPRASPPLTPPSPAQSDPYLPPSQQHGYSTSSQPSSIHSTPDRRQPSPVMQNLASYAYATSSYEDVAQQRADLERSPNPAEKDARWQDDSLQVSTNVVTITEEQLDVEVQQRVEERMVVWEEATTAKYEAQMTALRRSMKQEIEARDSEITRVREECEAQIDDDMVIQRALDGQIQEQADKIASLVDENKIASAEISAQKDEIRKIQHAIHLAERKAELLERENQRLRLEVEERDAVGGGKVEEVVKLRASNDNLQADCLELQKQLDFAHHEKSTLELELKHAQSATAEWEQRARRKEEEFNLINSQADAQRTELAKLREQNRRLEDSSLRMETQIKEFESKMREFLEKAKVDQAALKQQTLECDSLRLDLQMAQKSSQSWQQEQEHYNATIESLQLDLQMAQKSAQTWQKEQEHYNTTIDALQKDFGSHITMIKNMEAETESLRHERDSLRMKAEQLERTCKSAQQEARDQRALAESRASNDKENWQDLRSQSRGSAEIQSPFHSQSGVEKPSLQRTQTVMSHGFTPAAATTATAGGVVGGLSDTDIHTLEEMIQSYRGVGRPTTSSPHQRPSSHQATLAPPFAVTSPTRPIHPQTPERNPGLRTPSPPKPSPPKPRHVQQHTAHFLPTGTQSAIPFPGFGSKAVTPFATDETILEEMNTTASVEKSLMQLALKRRELEGELSRLTARPPRTLQAKRRKDEVEELLLDLEREMNTHKAKLRQMCALPR